MKAFVKMILSCSLALILIIMSSVAVFGDDWGGDIDPESIKQSKIKET